MLWRRGRPRRGAGPGPQPAVAAAPAPPTLAVRLTALAADGSGRLATLLVPAGRGDWWCAPDGCGFARRTGRYEWLVPERKPDWWLRMNGWPLARENWGRVARALGADGPALRAALTMQLVLMDPPPPWDEL